MTKFNSTRNKLKYVWDLSQYSSIYGDRESQKKVINKDNIRIVKKSLNIITKFADFSTEWEDFDRVNDKTVYSLIEIPILNISEEWINNLYSEVIFQTINSQFSLDTNYFYKVKTLQVEDIEGSDNKNLTLRWQIYLGGTINLYSYQAKVICYLYPTIKLSL